MPESIREQCLGALQTLLLTLADVPASEEAPVLAGLRVDRNTDFDETTFPTLVQFDGGHRPRGRTAASDEKTVEVSIEARLQAPSRSDLTAAVDAVYVAVSDLLLNDPPAGGFAFDIMESGFEVGWHRDAERPTATLILTYALDFEHASDRVSVPV